MSETLGTIVLRKVVEHYRANPGTWCTGAGSLGDVMHQNSEAIRTAMKMPNVTGCKHTMLVCYAALVAGDKAKKIAANDAISIFCKHYGLPIEAMSIHKLNDGNECGSAAKAIELIERVLGAKSIDKDPTPPSQDTSIEKPEPFAVTLAHMKAMTATALTTLACWVGYVSPL